MCAMEDGSAAQRLVQAKRGIALVLDVDPDLRVDDPECFGEDFSARMGAVWQVRLDHSTAKLQNPECRGCR